MLVVFFLICVNHGRYLISQTFISPIERWIIIFCGNFMYMIPFIHQFDYICWYPRIWPFLQTIVLNGSCFALISGLVTGEFPAQMSSNTEDVSIWWRYESQELRNCQFVLHVLLLAPTPDIPLWIGNAILHTNKSCSIYVLVHRPDCVVKHIST